MHKKKIIIFVLSILVILGTCCWRLIFVENGEIIQGVNYRSKNLIIHTAKQGSGKKLVILGSGYSMSINENNQVVNHDPLMILPSIKQYGEDTTVMSIFFPFESEGLEAAGKELSDFINFNLNEYDEITLIGHSKCGVCFANASRWISRKVNVVTISAAFTGTPIANQEKFLSEVNWIMGNIYKLIFSNHCVDRDIMIDSEFIQNADYSGLKKHNSINIISTCPDESINPLELFLMYLDSNGIDGDGIVPEESQELSFEEVEEKRIEATHATSLEEGIRLVKEDIDF